MKKIFTIILSILMMLGIFSNVSAEMVNDGWGEGAAQDGRRITISKEQIGGVHTKTFQDAEITADEKSYEVIVDLNKDYQDGELFSISLGFGSDADTYTTEFVVQTQKTAGGFLVSSGVAENGKTILISQANPYTYVWKVKKADDGTVSAIFQVNELNEQIIFNNITHNDALQNSNCVRYLWAFGREVNNDYQLDRNLVFFTEKPVFNPSVEFVGLTEKHQVGDVVEFSVKTAIDEYYAGSKMVKGVASLTGDDCVTLEYYEANDGKWYPLTGNSFGPETGFPIIATEAKFRATFIKAGTASYKIDIVDVNDNTVYATTSANITVEAAPTLTPTPGTPVEPEKPGKVCDPKDANCDGVITCEEALGKGWSWNNDKGVCEFSTKGYKVVNTGVKE